MPGQPDETQQVEVISSLLHPSAYPNPARSVRLVETHISYVFLAGHYVYKIKKPVNFGFLDYSSLEQRRHFCHEEIRLNQRLCPEIYLGVLPIVREGATYRVGGQGEAVEYAVVMRRLPAERMLDRLVRAGKAGDATIERVARRVAAFHRDSERGPEIDELGAPETIELNWRENFEQITPFVGRSISQRRLNEIQSFVHQFIADKREVLVRRIDAGRIRDCHGDMRAESICVTNGLCIHDCIEFNARFRYGDVASEVAFLAMDLDARGRPDLGYWFIDRYQAEARDSDLRTVLPFYQSYRAFVRGKVQSFRLDQPSHAPGELARAQRRARHYLNLAWEYAQTPIRPSIIVTWGLSGTGKTALARGLGCRLGGAVYSSDLIRKELAGVAPTTRLGEAFEAGAYAPAVTDETYSRLLEAARATLAKGSTVILDATFRQASQRRAVAELAESLVVPCTFLECICPDHVVRSRLEHRAAQDESASDADWNVYLRQRAAIARPVADEPGHHVNIDSSERLPNVVRRAIRAVRAAAAPDLELES